MGKYLDIDDVAAGNPVAEQDLHDLRGEINRLNQENEALRHDIERCIETTTHLATEKTKTVVPEGWDVRMRDDGIVGLVDPEGNGAWYASQSTSDRLIRKFFASLFAYEKKGGEDP